MSWLRQNPLFAWLTLAAIGAGLIYWLRSRRRKPQTTLSQPSTSTPTASVDKAPLIPSLPPPMIQPDADTAPDAPMPFFEALPDIPLPVFGVEDLLQSTHKQIVHTMASAHDDKTYAKAMKQLEQLGAEAQDDPEWLLTQASAHIQMGAFDKAAQCLHTIQTKHPQSHAAKDAVMLEMATEIEFGAPFSAALKAQRDAAKAQLTPPKSSMLSNLLGRAKKPGLFETPPPPSEASQAATKAPDTTAKEPAPTLVKQPEAAPITKSATPTQAPPQPPKASQPTPRPQEPTPLPPQQQPEIETKPQTPPPAPEQAQPKREQPSLPPVTPALPAPQKVTPLPVVETPLEPAEESLPVESEAQRKSTPVPASLDDIMATFDFDNLTTDASRFHTPLDLPVVEYTEDTGVAAESLDDILGEFEDDWDLDWPEGWDDPAPSSTSPASQPITLTTADPAPQVDPQPPQQDPVEVPKSDTPSPLPAVDVLPEPSAPVMSLDQEASPSASPEPDTEPLKVQEQLIPDVEDPSTPAAHAPKESTPARPEAEPSPSAPLMMPPLTTPEPAPPILALPVELPLPASVEVQNEVVAPVPSETPEEILASLAGAPVSRNEQPRIEDFQSLEPTLGGIKLALAAHLERLLEEADRLREQGEYEQAGTVLGKIIEEAPGTRYAKDAEMRQIGDKLFFAPKSTSQGV